MAAKPSKKPPAGNKNDIKTSIILGLLMIVGVQALLLLNKDKQPAVKSFVSGSGLVPKLAPKPVEKERAVLPIEPVGPAAPVKKEPPGSAGRIAFIIDDWGYTTRNCKYLKEIKEPLAAAILPNLPHTQDIAQCANSAGKDIMLHLPLEPYHNADRYPDNYLITTVMKPSQVLKLLEDTLKKMPLVQGVNNHMGSKATENKLLMTLILKYFKKKGLFFVDSMTSAHHSVCGEVAAQVHLPFRQRDVFLDNINTRAEIEKQIAVLAQKARRKGSAVAIGHDRELTMRVIKEQIPLLKDQGFEVVRIKDLLRTK